MLWTIPLTIVVLLVMAWLMGARLPHRNDDPEPERRSIEPRDNTASRIYEGNERAHQRNHKQMCELAGELDGLQRQSGLYGPSLPALPDGEIVDAEVSDVAGLLE